MEANRFSSVDRIIAIIYHVFNFRIYARWVERVLRGSLK